MWEVNQMEPENMADDDGEIGGIFKIVGDKQKRKAEEKERLDEEDTSAFPVVKVRDWTQEEVCLIYNFFID